MIKPTSPGNFNVDLAQVDCLFASTEFDELLAYFLSVDEPLSPLFMRNTDFNFSSPVEKAPSIVQTSPSPIIPPPSLQVTPPSASQPGSQEEQIEALQDLDDPIASQEHRGEETEEGEKTPEPTGSDDMPLTTLFTPGSGSSSKKREKSGVSKKKKESSAGEEKAEASPIVPLSPSSPTLTNRPKKLVIRPGAGSKGGGKKK